jgi:peptidyl-prolyl cis-trans isomerase SurA
MKTLTYIAAGVLLASQAWSQTRELGGTGELLDGVAAVVDSGVVLKSELTTRLELVMESLREQQRQMPAEERRPLPPLSVVEEQVLDQLVLRQIQLQRAERFGIVVGDEMLNQAISSVARENGITLEQMPMALASEGIDYAAYRQREQIIIEQLIQRDVIARITITPRELQQCLTRSSASLAEDVDYNLSHILVSLSQTATREQADAARAEIEARSRAALSAGAKAPSCPRCLPTSSCRWSPARYPIPSRARVDSISFASTRFAARRPSWSTRSARGIF